MNRYLDQFANKTLKTERTKNNLHARVHTCTRFTASTRHSLATSRSASTASVSSCTNIGSTYLRMQGVKCWGRMSPLAPEQTKAECDGNKDRSADNNSDCCRRKHTKATNLPVRPQRRVVAGGHLPCVSTCLCMSRVLYRKMIYAPESSSAARRLWQAKSAKSALACLCKPTNKSARKRERRRASASISMHNFLPKNCNETSK